MSMIVCKDWSKLTSEELEKELDASPELFTFNDLLQVDSLNIVKTIDKVRERVFAIIKTKSNNSVANTLKELYVKSRFQANCTELFFKEPPREDYEGIRKGPIACVYDIDGNLSYVNNAYIVATGIIDFIENNPEKWKRFLGEDRLKEEVERIKRGEKKFSLMDNVKYLANKKIKITYSPEETGLNKEVTTNVSLLFRIIYSKATILNILKLSLVLKNKGGYADKFTMDLTKKTYYWKTLENTHFKGNIRTAIDITKNPNLEKRLEDEKNGIGKEVFVNKFGFFDTIARFKRACDIILSGKSDYQLERYFNELKQFAVLGDTFIDESFFATKGFDGFNYYINKQFVINSPFKNSDELEQAIYSGKFDEKYLGEFIERASKENIDNELRDPKDKEGLKGHYNASYSVTLKENKDGENDVSRLNFDTFLIKGPDYIESNKKPDKIFEIGAPI